MTADYLTGDDLRSYLRGSAALKAEAALRGEAEEETLERLVEIAARASAHSSKDQADG